MRWIKWSLALCFWIGVNPSFAQNTIGYHSEKDFSNYVYLQSDFDLAASVLSNSFLNKLMKDDFIERAYLQEYDQKLKNINRFGYLFESEIGAHYNPNFLNITLGLALRQSYIESVHYTDDAFHLAFFGNKDFIGNEAVLDGLQYRRYNITSLDFAIHFHSSDSCHHFSLTPSLHYGGAYQNLSLTNATFTTSSDLSSLELVGDYLQIRHGEKPGWGGSFGMRYRYTSLPHYFDVSISDVGRLHWEEMNYTHLDTSLRFDGFEVQNLFDMSPQLSSTRLDDTLTELMNKHKEKRTLSVWLPIRVNLEYIYKLPFEGWDIGLRFHHRFMAGYRPNLRLDGYYHFNDKWHMSAIMAYGGYGGMRVGASTEYCFHPKMKISAETQYLSSYVLFAQTSGLGGFLKFSYQL